MKVAFYRWDGFSYFIPFIDFLPDLSLAFVVWTISGLLCTIIFWVFAYWFPQKVRPLKIIRFEYVMVWFLFVVILLFIYRTFQDYILPGYFSDFNLLTLTVLIFIILVSSYSVWIIGRYTNLKEILYGFNTRITPLVWIFSFLLIFSLPFLIFKKDSIKTYAAASNVSVNFSNKNRPNIILVTMDALTAKDMQLYGYERATTPFISEWAKDALVFKRVYSTSNWTTPTTMSIMTGQLPWTHRIWYEPHYYPVVNYKNNFPLILKENGYEIYGFVQNNLAHPRILGIGDVFSIKDEAYTFLIPDKRWVNKLLKFFNERRIATEMIIENNPVFKPINLQAPHYIAYVRLILYKSLIRSEVVYNRFLEHLDHNLKQPFFVWIHVFPPHDPYFPSESYRGVFGDAERFNTREKQLESDLLYKNYEPQRQNDVDIIKKRYDEFILYSDQQFKLFLASLSKIIDLSNTIIILSSDHGEIFSHGYAAHNGTSLYEPLVHIPLIIKLPDNTKGKIIDTPVTQIDIAPTILELAKVSVPDWMEGQSLLPLIEDKPFKQRPIFSMQLLRNPAIGNHPITKGTIAVWDGDYKLINYFGEENKLLLFDLKTDPFEIQNILNERPEVARRLKRLIDENLSLANKKITQPKVER